MRFHELPKLEKLLLEGNEMVRDLGSDWPRPYVGPLRRCALVAELASARLSRAGVHAHELADAWRLDGFADQRGEHGVTAPPW